MGCPGQALSTIGAALARANAGAEIWVAGSASDPEAGTYHERLTLIEGVAWYGGFAGKETATSQRDVVTNTTTIDGGGGGSVITAPSETTAAARLDGFAIKGGTGTPGSGHTYGGGIYCLGAANHSRQQDYWQQR